MAILKKNWPHCVPFQAEAAVDKELCEVLRIKLDKMKSECDKLATQLCVRDEAHALLLKKYQLLKQELHEGVRTPRLSPRALCQRFSLFFGGDKTW